MNYQQTTAQKMDQIVQLWHQYEEETYTEEMVQRVLTPVLSMIHEGKFDRPDGK